MEDSEKTNPRRCKQQTFEERYKQLNDFKDNFGHCNVIKNYSMDPSLVNWCKNMRSYYNQIQRGQKSNINLTQDQIARLEEIGFKNLKSNDYGRDNGR